MIDACLDCGVADGQLHELFCLKERCPFCGGQLASCECLSRVLQLTAKEQQLVEDYIDDSIPPLSTIMERWRDALSRKGRVPFQAYEDSPYHAAYRGDVRAVRDYLDNGLDVARGNEVGYTVLMAAARGGNLEILRLLLARGAKAGQADHRGYTALHWIVAQPVVDSAAQVAGVLLLLDSGADPNARNQTGITPLMDAAWFGCVDAARELLRRGADASARDNKNRSAKSLAAERGHNRLIAILSDL